MNFDVEARTILKVKHGSHAYGTNIATSDLDIKGICIEPFAYHLGFLHTFEQYIREASKGHENDLVIYSLKKFARLAADCNPNIIEVLHVDDADVLYVDSFGLMLREKKDMFLSLKARWTFAGYAHAQLKRIKTHRAWLLNPPKEPPLRKEFGLSEQVKVSKSELGAFENLSNEKRSLPESVVALYAKERAYQNQVTTWKQYMNWRNTRNSARAALEAQFGYDTKHAMHLIRLMRMCKEILEKGKVIVKRPDAEELLAIRAGQRSYESIVEEAEALESSCERLYESSKVLPKKPNREALDSLVVTMTEEFLRKFG